MHGLNELREQSRMTWIEEEHGWFGWFAAPEETTTSRRDLGLEPDPYTEDGGEG